MRLCAVLVLLLGLSWAVHVYVSSTDEPAEATGYVVEGGTVYESSPWDSRSYQRNLEYIGGKSAVLMAELREWFAGFWGSDTLAVGIAIVSAGVAACLLRAAEKAECGGLLPDSSGEDSRKQDE